MIRVVLAVTVLAFLGIAARVGAQLSPGPLAAPHAALEGSGQCLSCHRSGKGVAPELCLDCHQALGARIGSGLGLHARPGHDACERCHIEHHGRDFELVWWGDRGPGAFDHQETGHALAGAHAALECRQCHRQDRLQDAASLRKGGARLGTTFLGLGRDCSSCHRDVHDGGLGDGGCDSCHGQESWKAAAGFDHDRAGWPLRGRHRAARCDACHASARTATTAAGSAARRPDRGAIAIAALYVGDVRGTACAACHDDPHQGRLGGTCADCHRETSWTAVEKKTFDHGRTRFPLVGGHAAVDCAGCHREGAAAERGEFARCESCHQDPHLGQFAARADGGDCRGCHDEKGFAPARFSIDDHDRTAYPLEGAHRAVPCYACHGVVAGQPADAPPAGRSSVAADAAVEVAGAHDGTAHRYRVTATACADCHRGPHEENASAAGCDQCHAVSEWSAVRFDHSSTRFPLEEAHGKLACADCHQPARGSGSNAPGNATAEVPLGGLPLACAGCHPDVHDGQLAGDGVAAGAATACDRCHGGAAWTPAAGFDHDRDARFELVGAHRSAPCEGCHRVESRDGVAVVRYRPLATGCADCHAGQRPAAGRRP